MTGERMGRLRTIIEDALEQPAGERAEFVAIACADDTELKRTAEQLLDAESNFGSFLDLPETARVRAAHSEILGPDSVGGRRIGPYQLVQVLARGGMGTVFCAVRADDAFEQQVAIKLINRGMDSEALLRRFEQERQFLADLDHPNIARLLDGGTSEDGQPYIVMEYIEGEPIDTFCDSQRLGVRKRIELFRQVCLAVQYAHQNLVVHRDIKPANILVTSSGIPKLLDFGISKLLANDAPGPGTGERTLTGLQAMTPRYASPEQITGGRITTASDVYSLGVVLYELLSGHRPYLLDDLTGYEKERVICETEPTRPSTAVTTSKSLRSASGRIRLVTPESVAETRRERPDQLRRALRGDLDNIILRAMAKDSQRRYATAEQLSEDLQRHLDGRPINARTPSMAYRAVKFVKRNKTSVTAATIVVLALSCGLIVSRTANVQMREAE
ncbi:MAG: serine/threonine-protein kinase, partial [Planctomycetota bacterium]|nr:serine/threonine-protein kinase [Planctomycetota bacterium]